VAARAPASAGCTGVQEADGSSAAAADVYLAASVDYGTAGDYNYVGYNYYEYEYNYGR
jgi:hypothetical protein